MKCKYCYLYRKLSKTRGLCRKYNKGVDADHRSCRHFYYRLTWKENANA